MNYPEDFTDHVLWKDGARQELIPDDGETLQDAMNFMRQGLELYGHTDLSFNDNDVESINGRFYITLRKSVSDITL